MEIVEEDEFWDDEPLEAHDASGFGSQEIKGISADQTVKEVWDDDDLIFDDEEAAGRVRAGIGGAKSLVAESSAVETFKKKVENFTPGKIPVLDVHRVTESSLRGVASQILRELPEFEEGSEAWHSVFDLPPLTPKFSIMGVPRLESGQRKKLFNMEKEKQVLGRKIAIAQSRRDLEGEAKLSMDLARKFVLHHTSNFALASSKYDHAAKLLQSVKKPSLAVLSATCEALVQSSMCHIAAACVPGHERSKSREVRSGSIAESPMHFSAFQLVAVDGEVKKEGKPRVKPVPAHVVSQLTRSAGIAEKQDLHLQFSRAHYLLGYITLVHGASGSIAGNKQASAKLDSAGADANLRAQADLKAAIHFSQYLHGVTQYCSSGTNKSEKLDPKDSQSVGRRRGVSPLVGSEPFDWQTLSIVMITMGRLLLAHEAVDLCESFVRRATETAGRSKNDVAQRHALELLETVQRQKAVAAETASSDENWDEDLVSEESDWADVFEDVGGQTKKDARHGEGTPDGKSVGAHKLAHAFKLALALAENASEAVAGNPPGGAGAKLDKRHMVLSGGTNTQVHLVKYPKPTALYTLNTEEGFKQLSESAHEYWIASVISKHVRSADVARASKGTALFGAAAFDVRDADEEVAKIMSKAEKLRQEKEKRLKSRDKRKGATASASSSPKGSLVEGIMKNLPNYPEFSVDWAKQKIAVIRALARVGEPQLAWEHLCTAFEVLREDVESGTVSLHEVLSAVSADAPAIPDGKKKKKKVRESQPSPPPEDKGVGSEDEVEPGEPRKDGHVARLTRAGRAQLFACFLEWLFFAAKLYRPGDRPMYTQFHAMARALTRILPEYEHATTLVELEAQGARCSPESEAGLAVISRMTGVYQSALRLRRKAKTDRESKKKRKKNSVSASSVTDEGLSPLVPRPPPGLVDVEESEESLHSVPYAHPLHVSAAVLVDLQLYTSGLSPLTVSMQELDDQDRATDDGDGALATEDVVSPEQDVETPTGELGAGDPEERMEMLRVLYPHIPFSFLKARAAYALGVHFHTANHEKYNPRAAEQCFFEALWILDHLDAKSNSGGNFSSVGIDGPTSPEFGVSPIVSRPPVLSFLGVRTMDQYGDALLTNTKYRYASCAFESALLGFALRGRSEGPADGLLRKMARIAVHQEDFPRGLRYYLKILEKTMDAGRKNETIFICEIVSDLYQRLGNFRSAEFFLRFACTTVYTLPPPVGERLDAQYVQLQLKRAEVLGNGHRFEETAVLLCTLLARSESLPHGKLGNVLSMLAETYLKKQWRTECAEVLDLMAMHLGSAGSIDDSFVEGDAFGPMGSSGSTAITPSRTALVKLWELRARCFLSGKAYENALFCADTAISLLPPSSVRTLGRYYYIRGKIFDGLASSTTLVSFPTNVEPGPGAKKLSHIPPDSSRKEKEGPRLPTFRRSADFVLAAVQSFHHAYGFYRAAGDDRAIAKATSRIARAYLNFFFVPAAFMSSAGAGADVVLRNAAKLLACPAGAWQPPSDVRSAVVLPAVSSSAAAEPGSASTAQTPVAPASVGNDVVADVAENEALEDLGMKSFSLRDVHAPAMVAMNIAADMCNPLLTLVGCMNMAEVCYLQGNRSLAQTYWVESRDQLLLLLSDGPTCVIGNVAGPGILHKVFELAQRLARFAFVLDNEVASENLLLLDFTLAVEQDCETAARRSVPLGGTPVQAKRLFDDAVKAKGRSGSSFVAGNSSVGGPMTMFDQSGLYLGVRQNADVTEMSARLSAVPFHVLTSGGSTNVPVDLEGPSAEGSGDRAAILSDRILGAFHRMRLAAMKYARGEVSQPDLQTSNLVIYRKLLVDMSAHRSNPASHAGAQPMVFKAWNLNTRSSSHLVSSTSLQGIGSAARDESGSSREDVVVASDEKRPKKEIVGAGSGPGEDRRVKKIIRSGDGKALTKRITPSESDASVPLEVASHPSSSPSQLSLPSSMDSKKKAFKKRTLKPLSLDGTSPPPEIKRLERRVSRGESGISPQPRRSATVRHLAPSMTLSFAALAVQSPQKVLIRVPSIPLVHPPACGFGMYRPWEELASLRVPNRDAGGEELTQHQKDALKLRVLYVMLFGDLMVYYDADSGARRFHYFGGRYALRFSKEAESKPLQPSEDHHARSSRWTALQALRNGEGSVGSSSDHDMLLGRDVPRDSDVPVVPMTSDKSDSGSTADDSFMSSGSGTSSGGDQVVGGDDSAVVEQSSGELGTTTPPLSDDEHGKTVPSTLRPARTTRIGSITSSDSLLGQDGVHFPPSALAPDGIAYLRKLLLNDQQPTSGAHQPVDATDATMRAFVKMASGTFYAPMMMLPSFSGYSSEDAVAVLSQFGSSGTTVAQKSSRIGLKALFSSLGAGADDLHSKQVGLPTNPLTLICSRAVQLIPWELMLGEVPVFRSQSLFNCLVRSRFLRWEEDGEDGDWGESPSRYRLPQFFACASQEDPRSLASAEQREREWLVQKFTCDLNHTDAPSLFGSSYCWRFPFHSPLIRYGRSPASYKKKYKTLVFVEFSSVAARPEESIVGEIVDTARTVHAHPVVLFTIADLVDNPPALRELVRHRQHITLMFAQNSQVKALASALTKAYEQYSALFTGTARKKAAVSMLLGAGMRDMYQLISSCVANFIRNTHSPVYVFYPPPATPVVPRVYPNDPDTPQSASPLCVTPVSGSLPGSPA